MSDPRTTRRREPTGMNIYGETMAEYYQRRTNERGAVIERAKEALMDLEEELGRKLPAMREALKDVGR